MHPHQKAIRWFVGLVVVAGLVLSGCGSDEASTSSTDGPAAAQDFSERGPYAVGATRGRIDAERPVEVFYPAAEAPAAGTAEPYAFTPEEVWGSFLEVLPPGVVDTVEFPDAWFDVAPSADGPFPLVVISHGFGVERFTHADLGLHLASWGFVVALPEHPSRDLPALLAGDVTIDTWEGDATTLLATVDLLTGSASGTVAPIASTVDRERVAVVGHSAGGHDALEAANDDRIDAWVGLAPAIPFPATEQGGVDGERADGVDPGDFDLESYLAATPPPDVSTLMILADEDVRLPLPDRRLVFDWLDAPKRLAVLADTGHASFLIDCVGIQERGGSAIAEALGFDETSVERRTLENGCLPSDAPAEAVRATFDHLVVAQLRESLGVEPAEATASLQPEYLDATFPGRIEEYVVEPG